MTVAIFHQDSYLAELDGRVTAVDDEWIELDQTIFYAESGGQPGDTGFLTTRDGDNFRVLDSRKGEVPGTIRHQLESKAHDIRVGDALHMQIDWERRHRLMRMHTSMHLLGSLIPAPVTGGKVGEEKSRLDFDLNFDGANLQIDKEDLTMRINALIDGAIDVGIESITEQELDDNPGLVRTMSVQPPRGVGDIRMIRVTDIDYQPCGGTHVKNIAEIGRVRISKIENKGRQNRRVHLVLEA